MPTTNYNALSFSGTFLRPYFHGTTQDLLKRPMMKRPLLLLVIGIFHVLALFILNASLGRSPAPPPSTPLEVIYIQPVIREANKTPAGPDLSQLSALLDVSVGDIAVEQPHIDFSTTRNNAAASAAPSLQEGTRNTTEPFIKQAALLPGEGATVVLRIEVLKSGEPGQIEIDASSGSRQVDQAAVDYARTRHWYAGRVNGEPHSMWIRWGVRLQA